MHPEDIKAAIRKRFGSLKAFEELEGLPRKAVTDILRGRSNRRVTDAIRRVIAEEAQAPSINVDDSARGTIVQNPKRKRRK
jgi:lambda repressor-like predicted transcriptional regulator